MGPNLCHVFLSLLKIDDDVRVPYGKAHDTAREIVEEHNAQAKLLSSLKGKFALTLRRCVLLKFFLTVVCLANI